MSKSINAPAKPISVVKIAGAFVAFELGSGFATGQEAMQFFVSYGYRGLFGALVSLLIFVYVCTSLLMVGKKYGLTKNEEVFKYYCGNTIGVLFTWYTMTFIVAVHAVMLAGAGATLHQAYGMPPLLGSAIMAILSMGTLLLGLKKIVDIIGAIGPLIVLLTIVISIVSLLNSTSSISSNVALIPDMEIMTASPHWLLSGVLYVGLGVLGLVGFYPAIGSRVESGSTILYASILGPVFFVVAIIFVALALMSSLTEINDTMIPMMALAQNTLPVFGAIFAIVIFLGIYTTATPLLWTVCSRFSEEKTSKYVVLVVGLSLVGFLGGILLPFDRLVNLIYPTIGYAGTLFLGFAIAKDVRVALKQAG